VAEENKPPANLNAEAGGDLNVGGSLIGGDQIQNTTINTTELNATLSNFTLTQRP